MEPPNDINNNPHLRAEILMFLKNDLTLEGSVRAANLESHARRARSPIGIEKSVIRKKRGHDNFRHTPGGDIRRAEWTPASRAKGVDFRGPFYPIEGIPADDDPEVYPIFAPEIAALPAVAAREEAAEALMQLARAWRGSH